MRTEGHGLVVLCPEGLDDLCPEDARRTHFGDFHEVVLANRPEEREPLCEIIDGKPRLDARTDVLKAVREGVAELDVRRCARLLHVVARDGDAVELRHVLRRVLEDVADDAHGHLRRVDVGVAHHEFFQDVVLNRARHDLLVDALLLARDDEEGEDRQHGAVHRHGDGHLVERDAREEDVHIEHGADRDACLAHVADDARVVRIIAAMRREVKRDRESLLPRSEVAAVECVGLLGGRKACVLAYRPRTEDVHRGVRTAQARRNAARKVEMVHVRIYIVVVEGTHGYALHRLVCECLKCPSCLPLEEGAPLLAVCGRAFAKTHARKVGVREACHYAIIPFCF